MEYIFEYNMRYNIGQSFKSHHDAACASESSGKYRRSFYSILIYLNEDFEGGKTMFYLDKSEVC